MSNTTPTYVSKLIDDLFTAARAQVNKQKIEFMESLTELEPFQFLRFRDKVYQKTSGQEVTIPASASNHPSIKRVPAQKAAYFSELLNQEQEMKRDMVAITQLYIVLTDKCVNDQDLRDALPDMVLPENLKNRLQRTRSAAYTLADNPAQMARYQKQYRKMCQYAAMRLLG